REVLREHIHKPAVNPAEAADETIAPRQGFSHTKSNAAVTDKFIQLLECPFIEQQMDPFPCRKFAHVVLALAPFRAAARFRFLRNAVKLFQALDIFRGFPGDAIFLSQRVHPPWILVWEQRSAPPDGSPATPFPKEVSRQATAPRRWRPRGPAGTRWTGRIPWGR